MKLLCRFEYPFPANLTFSCGPFKMRWYHDTKVVALRSRIDNCFCIDIYRYFSWKKVFKRVLIWGGSKNVKRKIILSDLAKRQLSDMSPSDIKNVGELLQKIAEEPEKFATVVSYDEVVQLVKEGKLPTEALEHCKEDDVFVSDFQNK